MNRSRWLLVFAALLGAGNLVYYVWKSWGLVTVHSDDRPLSEVIKAIEKQGHVTLKSDLDPTTKVRMHVDKVPVSEALESLSAVVDARWRLTYFFAGDVATIQGVISRMATGERPEGWKTAWVPVPNLGDEEGPAPDPRHDTWQVKAPAEPKLQAFLEEAAKNVSAAFLYPENWNPNVNATPKSGEICDVAPKLAKSTGSKVQEVFMLTKRRDRGDGPPQQETDRGPRREFDRESFATRIQAEIDKLPPEKKAAAQQQFEERRQFFAGMRDLTPDQRQAKMEDFMSRPETEERMDKREMERAARRTPEQRMQRAHRYADRKNQILNGTTQR